MEENPEIAANVSDEKALVESILETAEDEFNRLTMAKSQKEIEEQEMLKSAEEEF